MQLASFQGSDKAHYRKPDSRLKSPKVEPDAESILKD